MNDAANIPDSNMNLVHKIIEALVRDGTDDELRLGRLEKTLVEKAIEEIAANQSFADQVLTALFPNKIPHDDSFYDRLADVAYRLSLVREKAAPLHWFLRSPFPSDQYAKTNKTPLLMVLAENDTLIPSSQSLPLFDLWQGPKELAVIMNAGHNDLHNRPEYEEIIRQFIQASPS